MKTHFEVPAPLTLEPMLIVFVIILLLGLCGCAPDAPHTDNTSNTLKITERWLDYDGPSNWYIITDTQTKAQYLVVRDGHGLVITDLHREPK